MFFGEVVEKEGRREVDLRVAGWSFGVILKVGNEYNKPFV